jgi:hypothetical protein
MKKPITVVLILSMVFTFLNCGGSKVLSIENPPIGASAKIFLIDGTVKEGVLLKKEGTVIKYIDTISKLPEDVEVRQIRSIEYAGQVYDLQGDVITESAISDAKGMGKTIGYGLAGVVLGAAVGFGAGAVYESVSGNTFNLIYPMAVLGVAGGIWLGIKGSASDREDAIDEIREDRYRVYQQQLQQDIQQQQQQIEQEKRDREQRDQNPNTNQNPGN